MADDPQIESILHSQRIAHKLGSAQMAVEVYGWAIKNAMVIPPAAFRELMDIVSQEPA